VALCQSTGEPIVFDIHREAKQFASLFLRLFNLTRFWAGFAKRFNQSFYIDALPECLLTDCMLLSVMSAAQWDYSPIIWLLSHPCTAAIANMSAFDRHILATIDRAMKGSNEVQMTW
jgi:hypothetical protein